MSRIARLRFRLWQNALWLRRAGWFLFAHSPLCSRFRADVLRLGPLRLCRSCVALYFSTAATLLLLSVIGPGGWAVPLAFGLVLPVVGLSWPSVYRGVPRLAKDVLRVGAGAMLALFGWLAAVQLWWPAAATLTGLWGVWAVFKRQRRRIKQRECEGCPELHAERVCSGFAGQVETFRRFRDRVDEELNRPGVLPLPVLSAGPRRL